MVSLPATEVLGCKRLDPRAIRPTQGLPDDIRRLQDDLLRFMPLERPSAREAHRRLVRLPRILRGRSVQSLLGFLGC